MGDDSSWNREGDKWRGTEEERRVGVTEELVPFISVWRSGINSLTSYRKYYEDLNPMRNGKETIPKYKR